MPISAQQHRLASKEYKISSTPTKAGSQHPGAVFLKKTPFPLVEPHQGHAIPRLRLSPTLLSFALLPILTSSTLVTAHQFVMPESKFDTLPTTLHFMEEDYESSPITIDSQPHLVKNYNGKLAKTLGDCLKSVIKQSGKEHKIKTSDKILVPSTIHYKHEIHHDVAQISPKLNFPSLQDIFRKQLPDYDDLLTQQTKLQHKIKELTHSGGSDRKKTTLEKKLNQIDNKIDHHPAANKKVQEYYGSHPVLATVVLKAYILGLSDLKSPTNTLVENNGNEVIHHLPDTDGFELPKISVVDRMLTKPKVQLPKLVEFINSPVYKEQLRSIADFITGNNNDEINTTAQKYLNRCEKIADHILQRHAQLFPASARYMQENTIKLPGRG